ncbi:AAA family ATPase [Aquabacterium sp.]|uniref:AAA family ATPase n=1 Tax=Aquabacterium sp. TaxID=1872578 RepID=UPI0025BEAB39|nr:AAA family ATPase [Aquabacterium sp.]
MAKLLPDIVNFKPLTAGEHTERELLLQLQQGLPDTYTVFHHLHVTMARAVSDQHGELDVVVMNRAGDLAALEIKAGELTFDQAGAFKRYGNALKDVAHQSRRQFGQLLERIRQRGWRIRLHHYLTLPHQRVAADDESLSYPRERIIDSEECRDLPGEIQRKLGSGMDDPRLREDIQRFMLNWLGLSLDVTALSQRLGQQVRAISGGLATWVPRIHAPSGVVRVRATAGSGKTQLALGLLEEAVEMRQRAAYVCFNRPLADHLAEIAPSRKHGVEVATFHQICWEHAGRPAAGSLDFKQVTSTYLADACQQAADLDLLVIDEMQDLHADWVQSLLTRLKATGRLGHDAVHTLFRAPADERA